ncbi:MAG: hypothetical protein IJN39_00310 [Clostridia bacterium]|nr:hypothetical protein [Clostridia bacterium]
MKRLLSVLTVVFILVNGIEIRVFADNSLEEVLRIIDNDYYYEVSQDTKRKIERIKNDTSDEETKISGITELLDSYSTYYTAEYCKTLSTEETQKSVNGFQTVDSVYIKIDAFDSASYNEFERIMNSGNTDGKALYIDLTDCGGGFITAMLKIAEWVIPPGVICTAKFKDSEKVYESKYNANYNPYREVYAIVSEKTASAGEILAGALMLYGNEVIGTESTFGKTSIQQLLLLETGGILKITVGEYLVGADWNITNTGINPVLLAKEMSR